MRWTEKTSQRWHLEDKVAWPWRFLIVLLAMPIAIPVGIAITKVPHSMTLTCRHSSALNCILEEHQLFGSETTQLTGPIIASGASARGATGTDFNYFIVLETPDGEYNFPNVHLAPWERIQIKSPASQYFQGFDPLEETEVDVLERIIEALNEQLQSSDSNFRYLQRNYFLQGIFGLIFFAMVTLGLGSPWAATMPDATITIKKQQKTIHIRWAGIRGSGVRIYPLSEIQGYSIKPVINSRHLLVLHLLRFPKRLYLPAGHSKETALQLVQELEQMAEKPLNFKRF